MRHKTVRTKSLKHLRQHPALSHECIDKINRVMTVSQLMSIDMQGDYEMKMHAALVAEIFSYLSEDINFIHQELDEAGMLNIPHKQCNK